MVDSEDLSPYPREKEVLLIDGCKMLIDEVVPNVKTRWLFGKTYTLIKLAKSPI